MKPYFRWLLDPLFHVFVIGIVLFQLGASLSANTAPDIEEPDFCLQCNRSHGGSLICPVALAKVTTLSR